MPFFPFAVRRQLLPGEAPFNFFFHKRNSGEVFLPIAGVVFATGVQRAHRPKDLITRHRLKSGREIRNIFVQNVISATTPLLHVLKTIGI